MEIYTKESLIKELQKIKQSGWIKSTRPNNSGAVGNTLEDLLGIKENNLPIPNAAEWELKCQRKNTTSLATLLHTEPSPRALKFVSQILLPKYGWPHELAGIKYPTNEKSFRQTIHGNSPSDRGFKVIIKREEQKVLVSFNYQTVSPKHSDWLRTVDQRIGLNELNPQPYWGFKDLEHKAGTKLLNCFYVLAEVQRENKVEYFSYNTIHILQNFCFNNFLIALEKGNLLIDFDARTGHNHGTKFRLRRDKFSELYQYSKEIR